MTGFVEDLRHAARMLVRTPGFSLIAVLVLSLALGASTAVFNVVDKVLLQPLPIADADRVVVIWPRERANPTTIGEISHWTFRFWQESAQSFESVSAIGSVNWPMVLRDHGDPTTLGVAAVSASFFTVVRTQAALGRTLLPEDDRRGAENVVVMSHRSWVHRFGADSHILNQRLLLDGDAYRVVGVMPDGFEYPRGAELWVPVVPQLAQAGAQWGFDALESSGFGVLFVVGRLKDAIALDRARTEVSGLIQRNAGNAFPLDMEAVLTPVREHIFGKTRPALLALAVSVALVLIIACANIATLLLIRGAARHHQTGIRLALGATRWRVVQQSLADALVLSVLGGAFGILLSQWLTTGLLMLAPADVPRLDAVAFDARTLTFAWLLCLTAAAVAGIIPGLHASRRSIRDVLSIGGFRVIRSRGLRRGFVVAQIGFALALLIGAGLVARSFLNLSRLDLGFDPTNVLTLDVTVPELPRERRVTFYRSLLERVRGLPAADVVGAIFLRPLEHAGIGTDASFLLEGQRSEDIDKNPGANYEAITPDYFDVMRMRVLRGRAFTEADDHRAPQVVIVSTGLARRLWPGQEALGKRLLRPGAPKAANGDSMWSTVVGVVEDARYRGITDVRFDLYVPYLQNPNDPVKHLMVRTSGDPQALARAIRAEALRLEPSALVEGITTMDDIVSGVLAPWRFGASTVGFLGVVAIFIATLGVYGIVRQSTIERTSEFAVRVALGASPRAIAGLALREGLLVVAVGVAAGLIAAAGSTRLLSGILFGVEPMDPVTVTAMAALFTMAAVLAMYVPAHRAARVDPLEALRYE